MKGLLSFILACLAGMITSFAINIPEIGIIVSVSIIGGITIQDLDKILKELIDKKK